MKLRHYHFELADNVCDQYNRFVNLMRKEEESSEGKFPWLDDTDERKHMMNRDIGQVCESRQFMFDQNGKKQEETYCTNTGGSHLSQIFWEHENLSGLSIIRLIQLL